MSALAKLQTAENPFARNRNSGYIPTLDGWRAIAIIGVLLFHLHLFRENSYPAIFQEAGQQGVPLFFGISGLLICSRLLDEEHDTGKISLRSFYTRRIFRIQPAAIVYLAIIGLLTLFSIIPPDREGLITSLLAVRNFISNSKAGPFTEHFWSLAIEEQFYLIFPWLLLLVRQKLRKLVFGIVTVASTVWMVYETHLPDRLNHGFRTDINIPFLILPAFLAILLRNSDLRQKVSRWLPASVIVPAAAIGLVTLVGPGHNKFVRSYVLLASALVLLATVLNASSWVGRCLEHKSLRFIGRISYSLYLWQQIFCLYDYTFAVAAGSPLGMLRRFPWNVLTTFLVATLSYFYIERPLIKLGHKLFPPTTPGHRDLIPTS